MDTWFIHLLWLQCDLAREKQSWQSSSGSSHDQSQQAFKYENHPPPVLWGKVLAIFLTGLSSPSVCLRNSSFWDWSCYRARWKLLIGRSNESEEPSVGWNYIILWKYYKILLNVIQYNKLIYLIHSRRPYILQKFYWRSNKWIKFKIRSFGIVLSRFPILRLSENVILWISGQIEY